MNNLDDSTYKDIFKWYNRCIEKYGYILLSLYNNDDKYNNYLNNLNKLHDLLNKYMKSIILSQQQYHDLELIFNKIDLLLLNVKQMKNNLIKIDKIDKLGGQLKLKKQSRKRSKKHSRIILSPRRMYSTIATGWI